MERHKIPGFAIEEGERLTIDVYDSVGWSVKFERDGVFAHGALSHDAVDLAKFNVAPVFLDGLRTQIRLLKEAR